MPDSLVVLSRMCKLSIVALRKSCWFAAVLTVLSCSTSPDNIFMSGAVLFSTVSKEEPSRIEPIADMNVPGMEGAISICSLGGDELAVSLENGSVLLKIFNLDQKEKSRDLIMRGRGPDEFAAIGSIRMRREDDSSYMDFNVHRSRK